MKHGYPSKGARALAHAQLVQLERSNYVMDGMFDDLLMEHPIDTKERGLALELVQGVLRCRETIDWYVGQISDRKISKLPLTVKTALRLGAYQILYLRKVPSSAAVNESVKLLKNKKRRTNGDFWPGYVNAVLRSFIRNPLPPFPSVAEDPVRALSIQYSCPSWMVKRWIKQHGVPFAQTLCQATLRLPSLTLRTNTLRMSRELLIQEFNRNGVEVTPTLYSPVGIRVKKGGSPSALPGFQEGWFYVEDEGGQLIPYLLDPQPGERVLDACSAPGGKTLHIAALMKDHGTIVAVDRSPMRLQRLEENVRRLGVTMICPLVCDLAGEDEEAVVRALGPHFFDRIIVDAPCSGMGVLKRHPEGKWQKNEELFGKYQERQLRILQNVSLLLRPGGTLVYSTCSTEPEENELVLARFFSQRTDFMQENVRPWIPVEGRSLIGTEANYSTLSYMETMDGFFAARIKKVGGS